MRQVQISNLTHPLQAPLSAGYCASFACKLRGLALRRELAASSGLLLVEASASRLNAGIHMLGMNFDLSIVWLDDALRVVDARPALRWVSFLLPRKPARYVLEFHASRLEEFHLGDQVAFKNIDPA